MANIIKTRKFVFVSHSINSNKVWTVDLYDNGDVVCSWGRIGEGKLQSKTFSGVGESFMEKKIREKTKVSDHYDGGCYKEIDTLDAPQSGSTANVAKRELKEIAKKQIASCPITSKLVEFFTDVNAHNIHKQSGGKITYDTSAGTFKTPIGIVSKSNIDEARKRLDLLAEFVQKADFSRKFSKALDEYLMLIPQDTGRKYVPKDFLGNQQQVQEQNALLDGLDSSYAAVIAAGQNKGTTVVVDEQVFNVKMTVLDDKDEFARINKLFLSTRKDMHYGVAGMKLNKVYTVDIQHMTKSFTDIGSKMPNIWELWHGTKPSNVLSILKAGFIIPPSSASYVCGRAFGNGVYFSNQSTKSLNYATSYWGGRDEGRYFMFLNDVAMGNYLIPRSTTSSMPPKGHDSYWAKPGQSGVMNDEMIVFKIAQIRPKFLCEFSK